MSTASLTVPASEGANSGTRYAGPIWTLVLLAPLIAEVLSGSTRLSFLFAFIPETMVWGCGALLCRELVRRWRAGAASLLLLGLALSIAEEFVIQQTSLAPLPFHGANVEYGRLWGVNWLYFLFMLGYESVWVVLVPVAVTELIFPARRSQPWLRTRGFITACAVFVLGSYLAWYGWVKRARPKLHALPYQPPVATIAAGVAAIVLLGWIAFAIRHTEPDKTGAARNPVSPWLIFFAALVPSAAWFQVIALVFTPVRRPVWMPLTASFLGALLVCALFLRWSSARSGAHPWGDAQRWSAAFGATLVSMGGGYLSTAGWSRADLIFKAILNVLALIGLLWLGAEVRRRATGHKPIKPPQLFV
ncbi:MAG TPA: hypothetical protein VMD55_07690 [Terracidiphilus sp.]|nr:hypothetical protein [Terracidiphilus sp.]